MGERVTGPHPVRFPGSTPCAAFDEGECKADQEERRDETDNTKVTAYGTSDARYGSRETVHEAISPLSVLLFSLFFLFRLFNVEPMLVIAYKRSVFQLYCLTVTFRASGHTGRRGSPSRHANVAVSPNRADGH